MSLPHFPFYASDWLAGTIDMSAEERGAYIQLLALSWDRDGLPECPRRLAAMAGVAEVPSGVLEKLPVAEDGRRRNPKLERVRTDSLRRHGLKVEAGKKGGRPKAELKQKESSALAEEKLSLSKTKAEPKLSLSNHNHNHNHISSIEENDTPLPPRGESAVADEVKPKPVKSVAYSDDFNAFWSIYPRKDGKGAAWESWKIRKSPVPDIEAVLPALRRAMNSQQWAKDGGQFIPYPATWINQRRWEDGGIEPSGDSASTAASYL